MASLGVQMEFADEVSPSASRYRIPRQTGESGLLMRSFRERQPYSGLSSGDTSLCFRSKLPRSSPQLSPWSLKGEPTADVRVELLESRPTQQLPSINSSLYPDRLCEVFSIPPMDKTDSLLPFEIMTNLSPIRPPGVIDPDESAFVDGQLACHLVFRWPSGFIGRHCGLVIREGRCAPFSSARGRRCCRLVRRIHQLYRPVVQYSAELDGQPHVPITSGACRLCRARFSVFVK